MVLAGKLGLYSILRFSFGIFPDQSHHIAPLMIALGAIGIVYGALIALVQNDLKKLAAFCTLGHVSFVVLGIFTFTVAGIDGGIYQTLNECLVGAALFMLLGLLYERYGTYDMRDYGGLATKSPLDGDACSSSPPSPSSACPCSTASSASSSSSPAPCSPRQHTSSGPSSPPPASSSPPPTCSG